MLRLGHNRVLFTDEIGLLAELLDKKNARKMLATHPRLNGGNELRMALP